MTNDKLIAVKEKRLKYRARVASQGSKKNMILNILRDKCSIKQEIVTKNNAFLNEMRNINKRPRSAKNTHASIKINSKKSDRNTLLSNSLTSDISPHLIKEEVAMDTTKEPTTLNQNSLRRGLLTFSKAKTKASDKIKFKE